MHSGKCGYWKCHHRHLRWWSDEPSLCPIQFSTMLSAWMSGKTAHMLDQSLKDRSQNGPYAEPVCYRLGVYFDSPKHLFSNLMWNLNISPVFLFMWLPASSLEFLCTLMYTPGECYSKNGSHPSESKKKASLWTVVGKLVNRERILLPSCCDFPWWLGRWLLIKDNRDNNFLAKNRVNKWYQLYFPGSY